MGWEVRLVKGFVVCLGWKTSPIKVRNSLYIYDKIVESEG